MHMVVVNKLTENLRCIYIHMIVHKQYNNNNDNNTTKKGDHYEKDLILCQSKESLWKEDKERRK